MLNGHSLRESATEMFGNATTFVRNHPVLSATVGLPAAAGVASIAVAGFPPLATLHYFLLAEAAYAGIGAGSVASAQALAPTVTHRWKRIRGHGEEAQAQAQAQVQPQVEPAAKRARTAPAVQPQVEAEADEAVAEVAAASAPAQRRAARRTAIKTAPVASARTRAPKRK
jgi:hypothetical protein